MGFVKKIEIEDREVVELRRWDWTWHYYLRRKDSQLYDRIIAAGFTRVPIEALLDYLRREKAHEMDT